MICLRRFLPVLTLMLTGIALAAYGQPGSSDIRTRDLPPPPGMEGTSAQQVSAGDSGPPEKSTLPDQAPVAPRTARENMPKPNSSASPDSRPPASMTTELRREEREQGGPPAVQAESPKQQPSGTSGLASNPNRRIAAFWLVMPQPGTRR